MKVVFALINPMWFTGYNGTKNVKMSKLWVNGFLHAGLQFPNV